MVYLNKIALRLSDGGKKNVHLFTTVGNWYAYNNDFISCIS